MTDLIDSLRDELVNTEMGANASTKYEKIIAYLDNSINLTLYGKDFKAANPNYQ